MIIREIHIDGFGIFRDFSIGGLKKGVNILLGRNEAGKSTLLAFLRYTLFGYPRSRAEQREPLNGGRHGGRIRGITGSAEKEVSFERFAGSKGGQIRLMTHSGESDDQSEWARLLGSASGELYQNVYAFSLDELVNLDNLSQSGVEDRIFSIGLGLGELSLGEVEKSIQDRSDAIYFQRGRSHQVRQITERIAELNQKEAINKQHLKNYQELRMDIQALENETTRLKEDLQQSRGEQNKLDNFLRCHVYFIHIRRAESDLRVLPPLKELPAEGVRNLDELETLEKNLKGKAMVLTNGSEERKGIQELEDGIRNIDFNTSLLEHKETTNYIKTNLSLYKEERKNREEDLRRSGELDEQIKTGLSRIRQGLTEDHIAGVDDMDSKRAKLQAFKNDFDRLDTRRRELEVQENYLRTKEGRLNVRAAAVLGVLIMLAGSVPAFYYGLPLLGAAMVLIAVALLTGRKFLPKPGAYQLVLERISDLKKEEEILKQQLGDYLDSELRLNHALSPEAAMESLSRVEQLRERITERDRLLKVVHEKRSPFLTDFERKLNEIMALVDEYKSSPNQADSESNAEINANRAVAAYESNREIYEKKQRLQEELDRLKRELDATQREQLRVKEQIDMLLKSIEADGRHTFRETYEKNEQVKTLKNQIREATENIENIVGFQKADEVMAFHDEHEKSAIENRIDMLMSASDGLTGELQEKTETLGRKKQEIQGIEGESELAGILTALETEKERLQLVYKEWLTHTFALKILGDVKATFEKDKQPEVIRYSSRYFKRITGNKYDAIRVSLGQKEVSVFDSRGIARGIHQLSRGTREQLLVSLRLGFIEAYEKKAEPLPIIVDEILVNFDSERAGQTAEILQEFAKDRQILLLTCHEATAGFFKDPNIITL